MTYMVPHIVVLIIDNFKKIMNLHNSISYACTILSRHLGVLGAAWPPTVFYFSSKNGSADQNETFSIAFLTKFLTNSWNEKFIGPFFFDLWMFKTLRGPHGPRLGGWRLSENSDYKIRIMSTFCIGLYREPNKSFQKFDHWSEGKHYVSLE